MNDQNFIVIIIIITNMEKYPKFNFLSSKNQIYKYNEIFIEIVKHLSSYV